MAGTDNKGQLDAHFRESKIILDARFETSTTSLTYHNANQKFRHDQCETMPDSWCGTHLGNKHDTEIYPV